MVELELDLFLRSEDVAPEAELTFVNAGEAGEIPTPEGKDNIPTFEINVKLPNGKVKKWTMNKTSQRAVGSVYGTNTETWINQPVIVYVSQQNVRGTLKDVIYAKLPEQNPAPAPVNEIVL